MMRRSATLWTRLGRQAISVLVLSATACGDGADVLGPELGGAIEVRVSTLGTGPESGYSVTVAGLTRPVAVTGMFTFRDLPAGPYSVELTGVTGTCSVTSENPQTVAVAGPGTVVASFSVACAAPVITTFEPSVAAGAEFTCGLTRSGSPYCWGLNFGGSLGNGRFDGRETAPTPVDTPHLFRKVGTGTSMVCGITAASELHCWGASRFWAHASPQVLDDAPPEGWSEVTVGGAHGCGLSTAGTAFCWGDNFRGRLGDGTTNSHGRAVPVTGGHRFKALSAGSAHTCGVTLDGRAYCWGDNSLGNLGIGTHGGVYTSPVQVSGDLVFESVTAGTWHSCGVTGFDSPDGGGNAYCWGENAAGNLGTGDSVNRSTPTLLPNPGGAGWSMLSAGRSHTCGVTRSGEGYCWGANPDGRIGDGTRTRRHQPTPIAGNIVFRSVSAGDVQNTGNPGVSHTCGVSVDGSTYCWGGNPNGGLGDGSTSDRTVPVVVRMPE